MLDLILSGVPSAQVNIGVGTHTGVAMVLIVKTLFLTNFTHQFRRIGNFHSVSYLMKIMYILNG